MFDFGKFSGKTVKEILHTESSRCSDETMVIRFSDGSYITVDGYSYNDSNGDLQPGNLSIGVGLQEAGHD